MAKKKWTLSQWAAVFFTSSGFVGFAPVAPGTFGSALAVLILWALGPIPLGWHIGICVALTVFGALASNKVSQVFDKIDSPHIVVDEIVGLLITMIGIPVTGYWLVVGFLLFRFFDVTKPAPIRYFDSKMKNGWGVMLDDVLAGVFGNLVLQLMLRTQA